jgi:hypothetical protein
LRHCFQRRLVYRLENKGFKGAARTGTFFYHPPEQVQIYPVGTGLTPKRL